MNIIQKGLINSKITGLQYDGMNWSIFFNNAHLEIYNPIKCYEYSNNDVEIWELEIKEIINHIIMDILYEDHHYFRLKLDNDITVEISLEDDDYNGPEAFCLQLDNGKIIVE